MATPFFSLLLLLVLLLQLSPFSLRCNAQNGNGLLRQSEVNALNNITSMLELKPQRYYDMYTCRRADLYYDGVFCRCNINVSMGNSTRQICGVTDLIFTGLDMTGVISPAVGNLLYLTTIDLSYNQLHGPIPNIFGRNHSLRRLDLSYNQLHGPIPNIFGRNHSLRRLSLKFNFLEGHIPPSLGDLLNLTTLDLTSNLLKGQIPSRLGNAGSLLYMSLGDNNLSGTIPPELGNLQELISMQLSGNNFKGELPRTFKNLKNLTVFSVRGNDLSGPVPDFITKWPYLRNLVLMGNNFVGVLPTGIFQLKYLTQLWVTDLRVSVDFSFPQLSNLTNLTSLILRNCSIVDEIPDHVAKMEALDALDLSYNNLTGEIPAGLKNLDYLCLTRNNFNGVFPDWAPNSTLMDFSYNNFTYSEDVNRTSYVNTFSPAILPTKMMKGSCPHEKYYSLYINCGGNSTTINGSYYEEDTSNLPFYISNKRWAYSSSGDFLASNLGPQNNTKSVTCGISVPEAALYTSARISPLTLDYYGLCLRNGEYNVTLHFAEIVFSSKYDHSIYGKRVFDIFIQGVNVVKDFNIKDEAHGPNERVSKTFHTNVTNNTLNIHLYWAGKGSIYVDPPLYGPLISAIAVTSDYKPGKKLSTGEIAAITASCVALPLIILVVLRKLGYIPRKKFVNFELEGDALRERKITLQNILDGTDGFSPKKEIGSGGSGKVYEAVLGDGSVLAVKKIPSHSLTGLDEFLNEAYILQNDGNILNLIDAAVKNKPDYHAKEASKLLDLAMMCTRPTMSEVVSVLENESTIEEISAAKHNNKPSNDSKHITASGSPVSVESTSTSFSGKSV